MSDDHTWSRRVDNLEKELRKVLKRLEALEKAVQRLQRTAIFQVPNEGG
jgi:predicted  nucleic acid-binding Zn-ribbon protein